MCVCVLGYKTCVKFRANHLSGRTSNPHTEDQDLFRSTTLRSWHTVARCGPADSRIGILRSREKEREREPNPSEAISATCAQHFARFCATIPATNATRAPARTSLRAENKHTCFRVVDLTTLRVVPRDLFVDTFEVFPFGFLTRPHMNVAGTRLDPKPNLSLHSVAASIDRHCEVHTNPPCLSSSTLTRGNKGYSAASVAQTRIVRYKCT